MKKITVYTNDKSVLSALEELKGIQIEINSQKGCSDLYIVDTDHFNCNINIGHPLIAIISDNISEIPTECEYVIQKPFDKKRLLGTVNLFITTKSEHTSQCIIVSERIMSLFDSIGMDKQRKGYKYLTECTYLYIRASGNCLFKKIFEQVASNNSTTASAVERSVRTAIEHTWRYGNIAKIDKLFGNSIDPEKGKPSNAEFISMIAEQYKLMYKNSKT